MLKMMRLLLCAAGVHSNSWNIISSIWWSDIRIEIVGSMRRVLSPAGLRVPLGGE